MTKQITGNSKNKSFTVLVLTAIIFILALPIVFAQTGLFNTSIAGTFAVAGIIIVVTIIILKEFFKNKSFR